MKKDEKLANSTNSNTNFLKLYYPTADSKNKTYPHYVQFDCLEEAQQAEALLNSLGFEKVVIPGAKSFDICVNLELKRYSNPHVAYYYIGHKEFLNFEILKSLLCEVCKSNISP